MSPRLFNAYMEAVMKEVKMWMERRRLNFRMKEESGDYLACMQMTCLLRCRRKGQSQCRQEEGDGVRWGGGVVV